YIAPDPLDSDIVYGGDTYGGVHRFDRRTGQSQDISPWPVSTFGVPMPQRKYRFTWTSPLVFDRVDRHALYLRAQMVLRTREGGPLAERDAAGPRALEHHQCARGVALRHRRRVRRRRPPPGR